MVTIENLSKFLNYQFEKSFQKFSQIFKNKSTFSPFIFSWYKIKKQ